MARPQAPDYEDRKSLIVENAARLFASQSFLGTSINDISKACNFSKSLLYHYYVSKEELLSAVMTSHIDRLEQIVDEALSPQMPAAEKLRLLLRLFMAEYAEASSKQKVLLNERDHLPEADKRMIERKQRKIIESVQALLIENNPNLEQDKARARVFTMLLFGMINWTSTWYNPHGSVSPDELAEMASDLIVSG